MILRPSKFSPPLCPASTLVRDRLGIGSRLFPAAKLVVVHAPAGYGKTTLLSQWHEQLRSNGNATAWITLDEADNDPARFLSYLAAALHRMAPELNWEPVQSSLGLHPMASPLGTITALIDTLANLETPFALFLDDFETITDTRVLEIARRLAEQLPMQQQLVIGTRRIPEIGFARLRVRGLAIEFSMDTLRFSEDETRAFLRANRGLMLSDEEVHALQRDTEGWVAALQLAALSLAGGQSAAPLIDGLGTCSASIAEYLAEDVLSRQPEDIRQFLMQTCILDQLSASLCDAVTGRQDSASILEHIEKSNLFLTSLDAEHTRFRYHSLFSEFLRGRLLRTQYLHPSMLHRRAATWYAAHGWWISAVRHALATNDTEYAALCMEQGVDETLHSGRMSTIASWIDSLPTDVRAAHDTLEVKYLWALIFMYRYVEARERLEALVSRSPVPDYADDLRAMRVVLLGFTDHFEEAYTAGVEELPRISNDGPFGRGIVASTLAYATIASGRFSETTQFLDIVRESHLRANSAVGLIHHQLLTGMAELAQGRQQAALRHFTSASTVPEGMNPNSQGLVAASVYLTETLYEINQVDDSEKRLLRHLEAIAESGMWDFLIQSHRTLAFIHRARKDWDGAHRWVDALEKLGQQRDVPRIVASARLLRAGLAIDGGDLAHAEQQLEVAEKGADWRRYEGWRPFANERLMPAYVRFRLALARGEFQVVCAEIAPLLHCADAQGQLHRGLFLRVLLTKAIALSGDEDAAAEVLGEGLPAALREGYCRTFLDEGEAIGRIMRRLQVEEFRDESHRSATHIERRGGAELSRDAVRTSSAGAFQIMEQFSDREIQVLHLVAQGLSNQTIAERLFLSEATIKFHLRNINNKTGAHNRVQAIAIARRLGLVD